MVKEIQIWIEGGGDRKDQEVELRKAFRQFLREIDEQARAHGVKLVPMPRGGRQRTWSDFCKALERDPDNLHLLLVDAERPVNEPVWQHLQGGEDQWKTKPALDGQYHLMAQTMEAWLVADKGNLERRFGKSFRASALPPNPSVETIPKADLLNGLKAAAKDTPDRTYLKTKHGFPLLATTDPTVVRQAAPHCARLFDTLLQHLSE